MTTTTDRQVAVLAVADSIPILKRRVLRSLEHDLLARTRKQQPDGPSNPTWRFGRKSRLGKWTVTISHTFVYDFPIMGPFTLDFIVKQVTPAIEIELGPLDQYETDEPVEENFPPIQALLERYRRKLDRSVVARHLFEAIEEPPTFRPQLSDDQILTFFSRLPTGDREIWRAFTAHKKAARRPKRYKFRDFMEEVLQTD